MKTIILTLTTTVGLVAFLTLFAHQANAQEEGGTYVARFDATFWVVAYDLVNGGGTGVAPMNVGPKSPLRSIPGFIDEKNGDNGIITHLDGRAIEDCEQLKKHHKRTKVRWLDSRGRFRTNWIYIQPQSKNSISDLRRML